MSLYIFTIKSKNIMIDTITLVRVTHVKIYMVIVSKDVTPSRQCVCFEFNIVFVFGMIRLF